MHLLHELLRIWISLMLWMMEACSLCLLAGLCAGKGMLRDLCYRGCRRILSIVLTLHVRPVLSTLALLRLIYRHAQTALQPLRVRLRPTALLIADYLECAVITSRYLIRSLSGYLLRRERASIERALAKRSAHK